jgi:hypothetical protein
MNFEVYSDMDNYSKEMSGDITIVLSWRHECSVQKNSEPNVNNFKSQYFNL